MKRILFSVLSLLIGVSFFIRCTREDPRDRPMIEASPVLSNSIDAGDESLVRDDITQSRQNAITRAISIVSPAVVGINVTQVRRIVQRYWWDDDPFWDWLIPRREYRQKVHGLGSGFLISPDGYILTNEHVVHDAVEIVVTTTGGKQYEAEKVGADVTYDVALLKIKGKDFPYIHMGDSDDIIIGEWVIASGNPFGLFDVQSMPTVTVGVVSATGMDFKGNLEIEGRAYQDMIQTDASINQGNSGGPLVNGFGECIGINTVILTGSQYNEGSIGIGFAIPINRVKSILPDLKNIGRVDRSFKTGLEVENISWLMARMLGISPRDGVMISRIVKRSAAASAGLEVGDVIVAIEDKRVRSTTDVQRVIDAFDSRENNTMKITIFRKEKLYDVVLELDK